MKSILPMRARGSVEELVGTLEAKIINLEQASNKLSEVKKEVVSQSYYMTQHIDGVWGRFVNVVDGKLTGGMIAAVQSQPLTQVMLSVVKGKTTKSTILNVTSTPTDIEFSEEVRVKSGDWILVESTSEAISTISLTLTIEK